MTAPLSRRWRQSLLRLDGAQSLGGLAKFALVERRLGFFDDVSELPAQLGGIGNGVADFGIGHLAQHALVHNGNGKTP